MFLNILRTSASTVFKMFLNIIVSIGCAFVIFHSYKYVQINRKHKYALLNWPLPWPARKKCNDK